MTYAIPRDFEDFEGITGSVGVRSVPLPNHLAGDWVYIVYGLRGADDAAIGTLASPDANWTKEEWFGTGAFGFHAHIIVWSRRATTDNEFGASIDIEDESTTGLAAKSFSLPVDSATPRHKITDGSDGSTGAVTIAFGSLTPDDAADRVLLLIGEVNPGNTDGLIFAAGTGMGGMTRLGTDLVEGNYALSIWYEQHGTSSATGARSLDYSVVSGRNVWVAILLEPAADAGGGGQTVTLGKVTETETPRSLTPSKTITLGKVTETETARGLSSGKVVELGKVTETESARALTPSKTITLGKVSETETVRSITGTTTAEPYPDTYPLPKVTETEQVRSLTPIKRVTLGKVTETETARTLTPSFVTRVVLGKVTETESVRAISFTKTATLGKVTETETVRRLFVAGNIALSVTGLPAGLSLTDNGDGTGLISGTIASGAAGEYNVTLTADDGTDQTTEEFTWTVTSPPSPPAYRYDGGLIPIEIYVGYGA